MLSTPLFKRIFYSVVSGGLVLVSIFHLVSLLSAIALVPLLYALKTASLRERLVYVSVFGATISIFLFYWMPSSAGIFNGYAFYGLFAAILSLIVFTSYFVGLFLLFSYLKKEKPAVTSIFLLASLAVVFEYLKDILCRTIPWLDFHFGSPFLGSSYTIQLAEFGGIYILSFFTIVINGFVFESFTDKKYIKWAFAICFAFLFTNAALYIFRTEEQKQASSKISLNLLTGNIDPGVKWENEGNAIVNNLLNLSRKAALNRADFNVWTETVVPWTYLVEDDFVKEVVKDTRKTNTITILGINTQATENEVFNSAYLLGTDGKVMGRYDKNYPLALLETPKFGFNIEMNGSGNFMVKPGQQKKLVETPKGNVGIYICNEATIPSSAYEMVSLGADFMINISNDGWFNDSYLNKQHFYFNRLRAVENRRDVVVNSNWGYKGLAAANGDIRVYPPVKYASLERVEVSKRDTKTIYTALPYGMLFISCILLLTLIFFRR